jgi:SAM-dependent methyltransferase
MADTTRVWAGDMSAVYEQYLVPTTFRPFAVDLAARIAAHAPKRVLELAAGTGALTSELARVLPDAEITATDLNQAMVDVGRERVPTATWQQADAMTLPFDDASFDTVAVQFGAMFFPDKPAAYAETRRVLTPDGRFIANVWDVLSASEFEDAITAALGEMFPADPPRFLANVPHGYADKDRVVADLQAGGLALSAYESVTLEGRTESATDIARGYCFGSPLRAEIEARGDLTSTTEAVTKVLEARFGTGPITGRMTAHVVEARPAN